MSAEPSLRNLLSVEPSHDNARVLHGQRMGSSGPKLLRADGLGLRM